mgnify:CR=1 FL=1
MIPSARVKRGRLLPSLHHHTFSPEGVAKDALYRAHRTSTVSPCAFCEREGHLAAPSPSFSGRTLREQRKLLTPLHLTF